MIYTSLVALAQDDMKKLIAYSSVAHMGFVTMGIFTVTSEGLQGAMIQMLSHGIVSAALFLCVGVVYDRLHTREIARYGGLADNMPKYAAVFMVFMLASIGLPGTSGFVGEFLSLIGAFQVNTWVAFFATTRHDPGRRLHALSLSPRHLRRHHPGRSCAPCSISLLREVADLRADDRDRAVDGDLSRLVPAADAAVDRQSHRAASRPRERAHAAQLAAAPMPRAPVATLGDAMPLFAVPDFLPALPEIFLGAAAMALLLLGVFQGDRAAREIAWLAVAALVVDLALVLAPLAAHGPARARQPLRHVRDRRLRRLCQGAGAARLGPLARARRCRTTSARASRGRNSRCWCCSPPPA